MYSLQPKRTMFNFRYELVEVQVRQFMSSNLTWGLQLLQVIPVIEEVSNPALKSRHWKQIFDLMGKPYIPEMTFSTNDLLTLDIMEKLEEVRFCPTKFFGDWIC